MLRPDPFENPDSRRLYVFICLIPVLGFFPALWALYRQTGDRTQRQASRLAIGLALGWLFGYLLLGAGVAMSDSSPLPLLIMTSLLTSGYFLVNIWLMARFWQRKPLRLPGL